MEQPKQMISSINETDSDIIISTPKKKSWVVIILLSLITVQFANAIIQVLFFGHEMPVIDRVVIIAIAIPIIYFILKGLFWQLKGIKQISINRLELKYTKLAPLTSKTKTYKVADIKSVNVKDESVSEGPMAMLQLVGLKDKVTITFNYGYETISTISGVGVLEANEVKNKIENKIQFCK
jgi:hypothetical protein